MSEKPTIEVDWHAVIHHVAEIRTDMRLDGDGYLMGGYTITRCDAGCPTVRSETHWNIRVSYE